MLRHVVLIAIQGQHIAGLSVDDLLHNINLGAYGVFQGQTVEPFLDGGAAAGRHQIDDVIAVAARGTYGLAVNGDDVVRYIRAKGTDSAHQTAFELTCIRVGKDRFYGGGGGRFYDKKRQ